MKLLITTQAVDSDSDVLGFMHGWIKEFSKKFESIVVICLYEGEHNLPGNVKVLSLGKEKGKSKLEYVFNFYRYIWQERNNYDVVFVHMNEEYVLLGWKFWRLMNKKILLWRNHTKGSFFTRLAVLLSNKVLYTSSQSFTARFRKSVKMPVGIDTEFFKREMAMSKRPNSILYLGRIAPVKKVLEFIEALSKLKEMDVAFSATIAGVALPRDVEYDKIIREKVLQYGLRDSVQLIGKVTQDEALKLYNEHELYVNLTPSGSLDKTIFEALATETMALVANSALKGELPEELVIAETTPENVANGIKQIFLTNSLERQTLNHGLREYVNRNHSLNNLLELLTNECKKLIFQ
jgi:glycosyltransferase involved in cell wall biosynthesis